MYCYELAVRFHDPKTNGPGPIFRDTFEALPMMHGYGPTLKPSTCDVTLSLENAVRAMYRRATGVYKENAMAKVVHLEFRYTGAYSDEGYTPPSDYPAR